MNLWPTPPGTTNMEESYTMHDNRKLEVVSHFGGWLRLRAPTFASGNGSLRRFLQGALSIEEVQAVTINPLCSSALIRTMAAVGRAGGFSER